MILPYNGDAGYEIATGGPGLVPHWCLIFGLYEDNQIRYVLSAHAYDDNYWHWPLDGLYNSNQSITTWAAQKWVKCNEWYRDPPNANKLVNDWEGQGKNLQFDPNGWAVFNKDWHNANEIAQEEAETNRKLKADAATKHLTYRIVPIPGKEAVWGNNVDLSQTNGLKGALVTV